MWPTLITLIKLQEQITLYHVEYSSCLLFSQIVTVDEYYTEKNKPSS